MKTKVKPLTFLDKQILAYLAKSGKEVRREELRKKFFETDRNIRRSIQRLRNHNYIIASSSARAGYRLTTNKTEVRRYVDETRKRARAMLKAASHVEKAYGLRNNLRMKLST
jgi:hypothetical protein